MTQKEIRQTILRWLDDVISNAPDLASDVAGNDVVLKQAIRAQQTLMWVALDKWQEEGK